MKVLWTLLKVAAALVLVIPVSLLILGVVGTVLGLAIMLLRVALIGLLAFGAFKLVARPCAGPPPASSRRRLSGWVLPRIHTIRRR